MNTKYQRDIREVSGSYYFLCLLPRFCLWEALSIISPNGM
jgi:hypothetical protein